MPHDNHIADGINKDLKNITRDDYLDILKDWQDPYPIYVEEHEGIKVVRDDLIVGSKARFGDFYVSQIKEDTIVYVQPRVGLAGLSILELAKKYNKKVILFMPASRKVSEHQAITIERGAIPKFRRIAAMPVLNKYAREYAFEKNHHFIPLGLYDRRVVAGVVKVADNIKRQYGSPGKVFCAISTGVLSRGLQIGFEGSEIVSVAVARNLKAGELGRSSVISEPLPFQTPEKIENLPPFPSVRTYDAKVWKHALDYKKKNPDSDVWFWNVGCDPELKDKDIHDKIDSFRDWKEIRD